MKYSATIFRVGLIGVFTFLLLSTSFAQDSFTPVIMNANFEDSSNRDDNREAWRNRDLEADADTVIGDGSWVLQMSTTNYTPDPPADQGFSGKLPTGSSETSNRRWIYQEIQVEANKSYTISWFMKQSTGNTLTVSLYDAPFNTVSTIGDATKILKSQDYNDASGSNTGSFIEQSITFESGSSTTVVLFITNDWENGSSSVNVDDFSIEENNMQAFVPVIMNANFEDSANRDDNRVAWRNTALEANADEVIGDGSWVLQMSTTNYTPDPPADQGFSGKLPTGTSETSNRRWIYQEITVEADKMYKISWYMKQSSGNTLTAAIYDAPFSTVDVIGDATKILKSQDYNDDSGSNIGDFKQESITFESGSNTTVVLFITNDWENGSSSVNVDDFTIEEVDEVVEPEFPIIANADFEDQPNRDDNRSAWRNTDLEADADAVIGDGSWVLQMSTTNYTPNPPVDQGFSGKLPTGTSETSNRRWIYQNIAVDANTSYTISWFMKQSEGNTLNVAIYDAPFSTVDVIGDATKIIASQDYNDASGSNTGDFIEQSITFESGSSKTVVLFITNDWENGSSSVNVDDFSIEESDPVSTVEENNVPNLISLEQNYPNPFNPSTNISYTLNESSLVKLEIFNMVGQKVATLVDAKKNAGQHTVSFNALGLSSGIYLYRLEAGAFSEVRRMTLIK